MTPPTQPAPASWADTPHLLTSAWHRVNSPSQTDSLDPLCAPEVTYSDAIGAFVGVANVARHIVEVKKILGPLLPIPITGVDISGEWGRYGWALLAPHGKIIVQGESLIHRDAQTLIDQWVLFVGLQKPRVSVTVSAPTTRVQRLLEMRQDPEQ